MVTGLANGVAWSFSLYAHDASGYGLAGVSAAAVTPGTNPGPYPPNAAAASPGDASGYVSWAAPPADGGAAVTDYLVAAYDTTGGTYTYLSSVDVAAPGTSVVFAGLTDGRPYAFAVYSHSAAGYAATPDGGLSGPVTPLASPAPFPVTSPGATAGDTTVLVTWSPPDPGAVPSAYVAEEYSFIDHTAALVSYQDVAAPLTSAVFSGLADATSYVYVIYAAGANGYSGPALTNLATPGANLNDVLNPSMAAATFLDSGAALTWMAPTNALQLLNQLLPVVNTYSIEVFASPPGTMANGGGTLVAVDPVGASTTACSSGSPADPPAVGPLPAPCGVIGGLANATSYYFEVAAFTAGLVQTGLSGPSNAVTPAGRPFPPTLTSVANVAPAGGAAVVSWSAPPDQAGGAPGNNGTAIVSYQVTATPDPGAGPPNPAATAVTRTVDVASPDPATHSATLTGLYNATTYDVEVTATNFVATSAPSGLVAFTPAGVPFAPAVTSVANVAPAGAAAAVTWSAPPAQANGVPGDDGAPITSYQVVATPAPGSNPGAVVASTTFYPPSPDPGTYTTELTGLYNATTYDVAVSATNSVGTGPASSGVAFTPAGVPFPPVGVTASGDPTGGIAVISWGAPPVQANGVPGNNGSPITSYTVSATPTTGPNPPDPNATVVTTVVGVANPDPVNHSATLGGLYDGTTYNVAILATNRVGNSGPSQTFAFTPAGAPGSASEVGALAGIASADVGWVVSGPNGSAVTSYTVTASPGGATATANGSDNTLHFSGLTGGTTYTFTVTATNSAGTSAASPPSNPVVPYTASSADPMAVPAAGGAEHSLVVQADGSLFAWGDNSSGQLGDGTTNSDPTGAMVPGMTGVVSVAAGGSHSIALRADNTVWAWGDNTYGELGDGTTAQRSTPVPVAGSNGIVGVAAGADHSLALSADGTVYAWGDNTYGQLGDGTTTPQSMPEHVPALSSVVAIAAAADYSLAVTSDGGCGVGATTTPANSVALPARQAYHPGPYRRRRG